MRIFTIFLIFASLKCYQDYSFSAALQTKDRSRVELFVDFDEKDIFISESSFICNQFNNCKFLDSDFAQDTYNSTQILCKRAELHVIFDNQASATFIVKIHNDKKDFNVFGMSPSASWKTSIGSNFLVFDFFNKRTYLESTFNEKMEPLQVNKDFSRFSLQSKLMSIREEPSHEPVITNSDVVLQFPSSMDYYNGNYFFMMKKTELVGWDNFLERILNQFSHYQFYYILAFKTQILISFDNRLFYNYDRNPFKEAPELFTNEGYTIGRFFVSKTSMKLIVKKDLSSPNLAAWVSLNDDGYRYGLSLNPVLLVQILMFGALLIGTTLFFIHLVSPKFKRNSAVGDYESI